MTQWNITIPDETDRNVRNYLERTGGSDTDLSAFVDKAVRQAIFWETVDRIQDRNQDLTAEEAQALADEAVADSRANSS